MVLILDIIGMMLDFTKFLFKKSANFDYKSTPLPLFYSISERREILKAQYHFACDCASCNRQDLVEFQERFSALRCHHCGGPIQNPTSEATLAHSMPCFDCGKIQVSAAFT